MFNYGINSARAAVNRYEKRIEKAELKYILQSIKSFSRRGYRKINWNSSIAPSNLRKLRKLGYKICHITAVYEIKW